MTHFLSKFFNESLGLTGILIFSRHITSTEKTRSKPADYSNFTELWWEEKNITDSNPNPKKETLNGTQIFFDPDFTTTVKQQRAMNKPMRDQLRKKNIKSYVIAPKLKIINDDGSSETYNNPEMASKALTELGITCDGSSHQTTKGWWMEYCTTWTEEEEQSAGRSRWYWATSGYWEKTKCRNTFIQDRLKHEPYE